MTRRVVWRLLLIVALELILLFFVKARVDFIYARF